MKVFLHIGDVKCGSTAVQTSLYRARNLLLSFGILYHPISPNWGHAHYIHLLGYKNRADPVEATRQARENFAKTKELIKSEKPDSIILSGESFFNIDPVKLDALLVELTGEPNTYSIIAFLRHPVDLYLSQIMQEVFGSSRYTQPGQFKTKKALSLDRWSALPSCESVNVRLLDRRRLRGGSVVSELTELLGHLTNIQGIDLPDADSQVSLSAEQAIFLQSYRAEIFPKSDNHFVEEVHSLVRFFRKANMRGGLWGCKPMLKESVKQLVYEQNKEDVWALDKMFSSLRMDQFREVSLKENLDQSDRADGRDLAHVLESFNDDLLVQFSWIVPRFNKTLEYDSLSMKLATSLVPRKARPEYRDYLRRLGLHETHEELLAMIR